MSRFKSSLINIAFFQDQQFLIPAYQRPYVWGDLQIKKMLSDFWETFNKNPDEIYYLGTVVTASSGYEEELIDGQQRFTTLWLIALAFEQLGVKSGLSSFLKVKNKVRLTFEIRSEVQEYLQALIDDPVRTQTFKIPGEILKEKPFLSGIAHAGEIIVKMLPQYSASGPNDRLRDFAEYISTKVFFVKNTAPAHTDLKKLFTTLNNSGVQLEQTDILKLRLLEKIKVKKLPYSKIWESCENMDNYFEHNVKEAFQLTDGLVPDNFAEYKEDLFLLSSNDNPHAATIRKVSLAEILTAQDETQNVKSVKTRDGREVVCESIITFPQLLLHTLRIYLHRECADDLSLPFHSNNLLESFEVITAPEVITSEDEDKIKWFFLLLWKVRYVFDKHIVKWVEKNGERLLGKRLVTSELSRGPIAEKNASSMLQSMLYFTGNYNTQMWLSPYLKKLIEEKTETVELEIIDDYLSLSLLSDKQATWNLMSGTPLAEKLDYANYLNGELGTHFKHYWFYKLEYVLWKTWTDRQHQQFRDYRMTSKNSVEHICSQKDEYGTRLYAPDGRFLLHTFGNLTLLSVGQNSSYGNQDTGKKYIDHLKKTTYDSLKLARFFGLCDRDVTAEKVEIHNEEMIALLHRHYEKLLLPQEENDIAIPTLEGEA
ncbi:DUF262 domain-containing protein [Mucilaginibacter sp. SJ]|uniref:DUF262 domain-containing protein n=1 Tax=Mucilaginibacter sp. SJ TaxID=3029053 RepID=UPI0023A9BAE7|nr:DUF262 domain-containing HNH endonuclease family protein [Mucilaginibacter sp. SJ]WEA00715.1 DUF262 domain-containing HNH endonuclease family protein [Mucilaginibacter sp. SJ]